jgi:hypothetical protein
VASLSFRYINQPAPISPRSFLGTPLSGARFIHMCLAPAAVQAAAVEIASIRAEADPSDGLLASWRPAVVWEPHPQACKPEQLEAFKASLAHVDVCSPNHEEAAGSSFHLSLPAPCSRHSSHRAVVSQPSSRSPLLASRTSTSSSLIRSSPAPYCPRRHPSFSAAVF